MQTVNGIGKIFPWNVEVDCAANFLLKAVPVREDAAAQKFLQSREQSEIGRCEIGRVRWVGEKLKVKSMKSLDRTHGSMRSRVVVQQESWCRSVSPLVPDVLLQLGQGLDVAFTIDSRPFTQELDPQRSKKSVSIHFRHCWSRLAFKGGFVPLFAHTCNGMRFL